jgi:hypothetical protein
MKLSIQSIITNKYVLYLISFLSLLQLFTYIFRNQLDAIIVFMLISYIVYTFTNNMTLIFGVPLFILRIATMFSVEGFEEEEKEEETKDGFNTAKKQQKIHQLDTEPLSLQTEDETPNKDATVKKLLDSTTTTLTDTPSKPPKNIDAFSKKDSKSKIENYDNSTLNASMSDYGSGEQRIPSTKERVKKPELIQDDPNDPNKINYASTLHSNLKYYNDILGTDGISKMTSHTKDLLEQQTQLGKSIEQFAPLMKQLVPFVTNATEALNTLNIKQK